MRRRRPSRLTRTTRITNVVIMTGGVSNPRITTPATSGPRWRGVVSSHQTAIRRLSSSRLERRTLWSSPEGPELEPALTREYVSRYGVTCAAARSAAESRVPRAARHVSASGGRRLPPPVGWGLPAHQPAGSRAVLGWDSTYWVPIRTALPPLL